ncbi:MAG TPA: 16S rRNA (cytosine(1402)-N(4))-methyltransferase RsmH [Candidatus Paceibacterota bacterium]|nr:16S rRNA (cytosine(1402)-N(4))-methyltransferase RsmH [Candidatus Paceibacterota bacterium]
MMTYALSLPAVRVNNRLNLREEGDSLREQQKGRVKVKPAQNLSTATSRGQAGSASASSHVSVLLAETLEFLAVSGKEFVVDGTAGQGGHSFEILKNNPKCQLLALDADPEAVKIARAKLKEFGDRAEVVEANFGDLEAVLQKKHISSIDKALFDLGWNSGQLASGRGFSFLSDEPLNMSYGTTPASGFTAREALNEWSEETLANVFYGYGEERYARRIARAVVETRKETPIETSLQFVELIRSATPAAYHHGRIHFATRSFQGLRMAVNDELGVIDRGIRTAWTHMNSGGRIAVITFHSIEDRAVKRLFAEFIKDGGGELVVKKPRGPGKEETAQNPRARSAKLRVIQKTSN